MNGGNTKGSVLIEFVIALPIMIFFIFAITDFSTYFQNKHIINNLSSSGVLVPTSIVQQKINDLYQKDGDDIKTLLKNVSISDVLKSSSSVIFNVFSMTTNKSAVKISCVWSIGKKVKTDDGNYEVKFYQERIDSESGGVDSATSSVNKNNILCDIISDSTVIVLEVFLQYSDTELPYVKKWNWINKWKNFKASSKKAIDDAGALDYLLLNA